MEMEKVDFQPLVDNGELINNLVQLKILFRYFMEMEKVDIQLLVDKGVLDGMELYMHKKWKLAYVF